VQLRTVRQTALDFVRQLGGGSTSWKLMMTQSTARLADAIAGAGQRDA
jgi:hypothetical protein